MKTLRQILITFGCLLAYFLIFATVAGIISFFICAAYAVYLAL